LVQAVAQLTADQSETPAPREVQRGSLAPREGFTPRSLTTKPPIAEDADALRADLAKSAAGLNPLLDQSWRRYLALPAEVYETGRHSSAEALAATIKRYEAIAANREYRVLSSRPEFQSTHRALQAYHAALAASPTTSQLLLPPPPGAAQR
jgi:hypothetical protein